MQRALVRLTGVEARIGPTGAGSSGNRSVVTTSGAGGIRMLANLDSTVIGVAEFFGLSLFGVGSSNNAVATQNATATAVIGSFADLRASGGDIEVDAGLLTTTRATASSVGGAIGIAVTPRAGGCERHLRHDRASGR